MSDLCSKRLGIGIGKNSGKFCAGSRTRAVQIGTIRKTRNGTYVKVSDQGTKHSGYSPPDWIPLQKKIWEDAHGKIPEGYMVCFLDCNNENFSLDNLYCIDRRISAILSKNNWYSKNPQETLVGIKWAELYYALKETSL